VFSRNRPQGDSCTLDSNAEVRLLVVFVSAAPCEIDRERAHTVVPPDRGRPVLRPIRRMKDVGPGNSLRSALMLPPPTDPPRRTAHRAVPENDQTKTTPFMPLQSAAGSADASSLGPRAPAAGGLEDEYQPTKGLVGDENHSTGAKTKDGSWEGSVSTGSRDPALTSHLSHQEETPWTWRAPAPSDASCTPGGSGELPPSSAACARSRPVDPPSAGIDRSTSKDREGQAALRSPNSTPTLQSPFSSIPLNITSSSSAAAAYKKPSDPMTGNVMRPDAVALPPSSTSAFDRIVERPEVKIEPLFTEPQGSLPHTSSCGVDHLFHNAWNGHPTSLPAYNNLTSEWNQAGIVGAAGYNGYAQPSITCDTHVQVHDVYSSAYAHRSPAPSNTSFHMVNPCWMPPLGPSGNVYQDQQWSHSARVPQPRKIARPLSRPELVAPGCPSAASETGALSEVATDSSNSAQSIGADLPHHSPQQLTTVAGGRNSRKRAPGLLQDPVAANAPAPRATTNGPSAVETPYIIPSPTIESSDMDGIGEEGYPGAPETIRSGTTTSTPHNIPALMKINVVAGQSLDA